jgi:hypothetical protein
LTFYITDYKKKGDLHGVDMEWTWWLQEEWEGV